MPRRLIVTVLALTLPLLLAGAAAPHDQGGRADRAATGLDDAVRVGARVLDPALRRPMPAHHHRAPSTGGTVGVAIPQAFRLDILREVRTVGRCEVVVAVTDSRPDRVGFTVVAQGGGRGTLSAAQVPGNAMQASAVRVEGRTARYPAGAGIGSVRLTGTFETCPRWSLG